MKISSQSRATYADLVQSATTQVKDSAAQRGGTVSDAGDRFDLSPESAMRLSTQMLETAVGKQVSDAMSKYGVSLTDAVGVDFSPEATAQRIADFATGLFGIFRDQNKGLADGAMADKFEHTIRGAVDRGYKEAQQILGSMGLDGNADAGSKTIELVHKHFDDFLAKLRAPPADGSQQAAPA